MSQIEDFQIHGMIPYYGTHGSRQQINNNLIQDEYKICVVFAEACGNIVHFRPYEGAKKGKQVASSTKWGLGENVVLRLIGCLTPTVGFDIFMDNYLIIFSSTYPPWS